MQNGLCFCAMPSASEKNSRRMFQISQNIRRNGRYRPFILHSAFCILHSAFFGGMNVKVRATQAILECLLEQEVDTVFGYPGGTILNL